MSDLMLLGGSADWATTILSALALFAARATVLLLGAWGLTRLMRGASAATRHLVWTATITAVLALPFLSATLPRWNVPVVPIAATLDAPVGESVVASAPTTSHAAEPVAPRMSTPVEAQRAPAAPAAAIQSWFSRITVDATDVMAGAWLAVAVLLILRLAIANARVLSWRRSSSLVEDLRWNTLLRRLTREHEIERPVVLLESHGTDVPVTWGIVYPVVLLPAASAEWDEERRIAVLTHELAHVKRFDALSQLLAQLALALLWFHPLAWLAVRRMRMEREHACDDFVLVAGARASRYADDLLGLARRIARPTVPAAAALAMARRSELEGRLLAILDPTAPRGAVRSARVLLASLLVFVLAMPLAAFRPAARVSTATKSTPSVAAASATPVVSAPAAPAPKQPAPPRAPAAQSPLNAPQIDAADRSELEALPSGPAISPRLTDRTPRIGRIDSPALRIVRDTEPDKPVEVATLVEVAKGVKRMSSDYEKGQLLALIAKRYVRSDSLRDAYLDAVFSMTSDYERSKALIALLDRDSIPAAHTARVLRTAALMTSDQSRGQVLRKISPVTFADSTVQRAYLDVIGSMSSNTERAAAIGSLVRQEGLPQAVQLGILRATTAITSNTEKANVLVLFQERQGTTDPAVRRAFIKSAETLTSDGDYRRVMTALMR